MDYLQEQVQQKDVGRRLQVGPELLEFVCDSRRSSDLEQDKQRLDKVIDELTGWVSSSNYKVALLGLDLLNAFVDRLCERFRPYLATVLTALVDRLGDAKDQVREQSQNLILKLMEQTAPPMHVWERLATGFKHKNFRTREGVCMCLIATLNTYGAQQLVLSKLVPHLCTVFGDSNSQVRDAAILTVVEMYRHAGEKVRADLKKRGIPAARLQTIFAKFDEVRDSGGMMLSFNIDKSFDDDDSVDGNRQSTAASAFKVPAPKKPGNPGNSSRKPGSSTGSKVGGASKEGGAGALDEEDFIKAFTDVPVVQIYSNRELEETLNKIREILSDDKHDWDQRANALKKVRSLLVAGAADNDCFFQHLRLLDGAFKLSVKDLRSQVVREACITVAHISTILGNKFDHGAESIVPPLFNLVPNCAKVMATSGCAAIRIIIRHTHVPRLIPLITSNCSSKSVAVRRRCFDFLDLLLQEWQTHSLERHVAVLVETIKKGMHDADAEARVEARKAFWGLRNHFPSESDALYNSLEPQYQKNLQSNSKGSSSVASLPQSDRSSSSSQESLNRPFTSSKWSTSSPANIPGRVAASGGKTAPSPGTLQRSRSDIDVNAATSAKVRHVGGQPTVAGRLASALPPGSYASLEDTSDKVDGRIRTKLSAASAGIATPKTDSRGRSRTKLVSQSQRSSSPDKNEGSQSANPIGAGSRSGSPGRVLTTTTLSTMNSGVQRILGTPPSAQKRSKIPRSQGCSREASPSRLSVARGSRIPRPSVSQGCSREASRESSRDTSPVRSFLPLGSGFSISQQSRLSSSVSAMRVLNTGSDVEEAVADALKKPARRRYESYGMYSDDDANSDASSACSERSYSSRNGSIPTYMRQTEDVAEVLNRCASSNWSERKEGLLGLQNLLKNQRTLSRVELKRLCEIFTRMFADPHSKVFSMFLETLVDFIVVHKEDLQDWLFVLLTQLLKKMGADLLGSVQAKVQKALDVARESFPNDLQFNILMRFTVDQTQTPNLKTVNPALQDQLRSFWSTKVKVAILKYIETLAQQMDPGDFVNSSETRLAVSRIITWTTEPKSSDVRKAAQCVLISLFELNTPEFTMLLGALPKTFQDGATKLLQHHLRNAGNGGQVSTGSPLTRPAPRSPASWASPLTSPTNTSLNTVSLSAFEDDTENMNSEDIYCSLRGVTEAIQNFSFRSQEDMNEPLRRESKKENDTDSMCSGTGMGDPRGGGDALDTIRTALDNKTSLLNTMPLRPAPRSRDYNPNNYSDSISSLNKSALKEAMFDDDVEQFPDDVPLDHSELISELLKELSNHNERVEERKTALCELLKFSREESYGVWDEHFKTILLLLLETLGDKENSIRALALRVLREILRYQPARFKNYAELTIMKTLEAHKDPHKEVVRAAEEAAATLATSISPDQCIKVLCPIIQTADYPINLAAIKMQTKVTERVSKDVLGQLLPEIVPGLIQGYDNSESSVRKACVFCLVAIYAIIGDDLKPHLSQLTGSKMKLLNLYIKRAQTGSGSIDPASDHSGQS
ncbi:CLIP-associating protein 2 isoform X13 [Ambystoma mexicanum]|uniref:CLIP-associating protein 2 isoform X13 n=1 Tax=Ambystoma mexicanum TaxID=8296 RepID=UPI0037E854ED